MRWSDGEVTAYGDVGANQLKAEHQLRPAESPWSKASLATVGTFGGDGDRSDDVVVLWPDSHLTMNSDTTISSLERERTLVPGAWARIQKFRP
ncbi:hypothetical protein [Streptomyces rimosus]|uniref:hypothetical protein n=1 Tax=Streptomyces rimosus TaxID=1927 RepID=UPI0037BC2E84